MKTINLVFLFASSILCRGQGLAGFEPYREGEVRSALLENAKAQGGLDQHEKEKQAFFVKEVREALSKVKIANTAIVVGFYEDEAAPNAIQSVSLGKILTTVDTYRISIKRSDLLGQSETVLSHIAYYVVCGLNNADGENVPEKERFRRAEYLVYKTVGWKKYKEFLLAAYDLNSGPVDEFLKKRCEEIGISEKDLK